MARYNKVELISRTANILSDFVDNQYYARSRIVVRYIILQKKYGCCAVLGLRIKGRKGFFSKTVFKIKRKVHLEGLFWQTIGISETVERFYYKYKSC